MEGITPLSSDPVQAIVLASEHAPYLKTLWERHGEALQLSGPESLFAATLNPLDASPEPTKALRLAKQRAHLAIAALDLSRSEPLMGITTKISQIADACVQAALNVSLDKMGLSGDGLFLAALGKMGAFELNYSSDIDMAAFFDADRFEGGRFDPGQAAMRVVRDAMQLLEARTADGYVFRTDLRLRPDPSSTPLAVSLQRATNYYESYGQNWERMVWIKGRCCAGDEALADKFMEMITPFVWRRHLDYWAIDDVRAIKDMINSKVGDHDLEQTAPDVKLGPGGIREIEFFVQTQQIIMGGRFPNLRTRSTLEGLEALVGQGAVAAHVSRDLQLAYTFLRDVEHRIQMRRDEQTHIVPIDESDRASVAALCGISSVSEFDAKVRETRECVNAHYRDLFADGSSASRLSVDGNLVFTGVDNDPGTVATLNALGFKDASSVISSVRRWHHGQTSATRTRRGQELLTRMLPGLLTFMAETGEPDAAFARFRVFLEGLTSGVQTLSMLAIEDELREDVISTLALAPRIAGILAKRPSLIEILISDYEVPPPPIIDPDDGLEASMNAMRRWQGERAFEIGHRLLHGRLPARDAAKAWSDLAVTCVTGMAQAAAFEVERRFGPAPGTWVIAGLGKLGGHEMTAGSDLDLIVVFDPTPGTDAQPWFTRFTQRLMAALSAQTGEGRLYEVDMRLRPSGRSGPVATSLASFERYHREDAWTWERMALTRLAIIAGDSSLGEQVRGLVRNAIRSHSQSPEITSDILDMRRRLLRDKPAKSPWDLKMRRGGLLDIEFIMQHAQLVSGSPDLLHPTLSTSLQRLGAYGLFTPIEATNLFVSYRFLQSLQHIQRLALGDDLGDDSIGPGLADCFARAVGCPDFESVERDLAGRCADVSALFAEKIGDPATESKG